MPIALRAHIMHATSKASFFQPPVGLKCAVGGIVFVVVVFSWGEIHLFCNGRLICDRFNCYCSIQNWALAWIKCRRTQSESVATNVAVESENILFSVYASDVCPPPNPLIWVDTHVPLSGPCTPQSQTICEHFLSVQM